MSIVAIVMPVFNNWHFTKQAIEDLSHLSDGHSVLIIDNGSSDETKDLQSNGKVFVIKCGKNLGFASACNAGYSMSKQLGYKYVMFLNNDIRVRADLEGWTDPILTAAAKGKLVGPTVGVLDDNLNFVCEASKMPTKGRAYMSGWNLTASIETWDKLVLDGEHGPFSTEFGRAYFEDTDLGFRAQQLGIEFEIIQVPVHHFGKQTSRKLNTAQLYTDARKVFLDKWGKK